MMDIRKVKATARQANEQRYLESSKEKLKKLIVKAHKTTMIGALAKFEDYFGHLWGHDSNRRLTEEQKKFREIWSLVRTEILNNGNNQLRDVVDEELPQYNVRYEGYKKTFNFNNRENRDYE